MTSTLYICYFGVQEPLVHTQVVPYLVELSKSGIKVHFLTFEPKPLNSADEGRIRTGLRANGIEWTWHRYHKRPSALATAYDVFSGAMYIRQKIHREKIDVLHGRVHIPTLMGAIARRFSKRKPKLLFDIRGFFPEEYTDAGVWPADGLLFRMAKRVERWLLKDSDGFVVLTEAARTVLFPESENTGIDLSGRPVEVIPCCVDFERRFPAKNKDLRLKARETLNLSDRTVIVHLGALGGLYLTKEIVDFISAAKSVDPSVYAMLLTQSDPREVTRLLEAKGMKPSDFIVKTVNPTDVRNYLYASDIALSFVQSSYSTISRSPTKIPEYLACGLPIITNAGVGDVDELITTEKVGAILADFNDPSYIEAFQLVKKLTAIEHFDEQCRASAMVRFDLVSVGGTRYQRIYSQLTRVNK